MQLSNAKIFFTVERATIAFDTSSPLGIVNHFELLATELPNAQATVIKTIALGHHQNFYAMTGLLP